jgi:hypothetical protein
MLTPFLLIGVGGSGGKTLRTAKAALERRLDELGWEGDLPAAWQFLQIDVPTVADGVDPDLPGVLPARDYAGLVASGVTYRTVDDRLSADLSPEVNLRATGGWRPIAEQVQVPIDKGAGQYRAIGRVITVTHLDQVRDAIEGSMSRLRAPEVKGELGKVGRLLGVDDEQGGSSPVVVIVSSMAGGTGAGAVVDVSWTVRAAGISPDDTFSMLYAPDVFDNVAGPTRGVQPNALATLAELCAAGWNADGVSSSTQALYGQTGVNIPSSRSKIPRMVLVGRRNSNVDYVDQNKVYVAMGRSLAAWMTSPHVQDTFSAYFTTNSQPPTTNPDLPSLQPTQFPPFRGIGFARVALGRDLFREYAKKWLARQGIGVVLSAHEDTRNGHTDTRTPEELIEDKGKLDLRHFLHEAGLDERGLENNQVIDAFNTSGEHYEKLIANINNYISNSFGSDGLDQTEVVRQIDAAVERNKVSYFKQERDAQVEKARGWVRDIQEKVSRAVATSIARRGALVTAYMLDRTIRQEIPEVIEELRQESARHLRNTSQETIRARVREKLAVENQSYMLDSAEVRAAVKIAALCCYEGGKASRRDLAVELLDDLKDNFLEPLHRSVRYAYESLNGEKQPQGATPSPIDLWPTEDIIPKSLMPSSNEFLLEGVDSYYEKLQTLIRESIPKKGAGDPVGNAVASVLVGADVLTDDPEQEMVVSRATWVPRNHEFSDGVEASRRATFEVLLGADEILERARDWSGDTEKAIGKYVKESLNTYLSEDSASPQVVKERLLNFQRKLESAVRAAEPLLEVDREMLQKVHRMKELKVTYLFSEFPFREGTAKKAIETFMEQVKSETEGTLKFAYKDSEAQFIDIFALMDSTLQPVVIRSLMVPMAEQWSADKMTAATREQFWRWRRSRSMPEFIPLAPAIRRAMVRGFFTARLLGRLQLSNQPGQGCAILDAEGKSYGFPNPLLQLNVPNYDYIPALLKSIPLAWLDCMNERYLGPMLAYRILGEYGEGVTDSSGNLTATDEYVINRELSDFLLEEGSETGGSEPDRRQHLLNRIKKWKQGFEQLFMEVSAKGDPHRVPRAFEMQDDIISALDDLAEAIERWQPEADEGDFI